MGLGGDLLLASSIAEYNKHTGFKVALVAKPKLSDLLRGRLFRPLHGITHSPVFQGNPHINVPEQRDNARASSLVSKLDLIFEKFIATFRLNTKFDLLLQFLCYKRARATGIRYLYKDDIRFSYAKSVDDVRMVWRSEPNAVAATLSGFLAAERPESKHPQVAPKFYELDKEDLKVSSIMKSNSLSPSSFLVIEPSTNTDWFANLRAWPFDRWQAVVNHINEAYPSLTVVRVGLQDSSHLDGVIDLRGQTTFRQAALLIKRSRLFIGTEGGLMHAARAVGANSVVLWGGLTSPEFAGYPDSHMIINSVVSCAPCGLLGNCPYDVKCMKNIGIQETCSYLDKAISDYSPGIRYLS